MAALPSFVELMASLGLEQRAAPSRPEQSPSPPPPSSPDSPRIASRGAPTKSSSNPSLRETATRHRVSRFSPYSPVVSFTRRRGSLSSVSSSDFDSSPLSATFSIPPRPTATRPRKYRNKLTVTTYESSSDLAADTPISTYVRRKTPGTSPTSPTFHRDSGYESSSPTPMPFSIPSLPVLLPHSASSESFPDTTSDSDSVDISRSMHSTPLTDITEGTNYYRYIRRRTGTRISTPPRSARSEHHPRTDSIVD
ncbi:hypothetical protein NLJ89_g7653 [Agrocybe chaxingu]|uniref:Uncharacterized protein n=1 Tax=Agrocybe chaxingu TaxID=84603 RepID=A0A9W8JU62_9AGAR|nr:hypothetical protein NLJ89_g7653 [Agrocybe chaxingu]